MHLVGVKCHNKRSFYCSDQDGEVELDDVWFAYPSRPNHMVLKVIIMFSPLLIYDCDGEKIMNDNLVAMLITL